MNVVLGKAVDRKMNDVSKCILFSINELSTVSIYCIYVCVCAAGQCNCLVDQSGCSDAIAKWKV